MKDMHISRSGLSCCVVSGVSHEALKRLCIPRDESSPEELQPLTARSEHSVEDGETAPYYTLMPPNDLEIDENTDEVQETV